MRAHWLPSVLRAAGLTVHEVAGWRTRGADSWGPVRGITCHHTAGSRNSSIQGEINVLLNGSASAPPPIAQLFLARNGEWYVVASGLCFHNKVGWDGPNEGYGNDSLLGIEAQHSGGDEPWTAVQYNSYVRGVAALVRHRASGWDVSVSRVAGHKEHQPGSKSDPSFNMDIFRGRVAAEIREMDQEDDMLTAEEIARAVWAHPLRNPYSNEDQPAGTILRYVPSRQGHLDTQAAIAALDAARRAYEDSESETDAAVVGQLAEIRTLLDQSGGDGSGQGQDGS
jgi:hypothetical protein